MGGTRSTSCCRSSDLNWLVALAGLSRLDRRVAEPLYFFALAGTAPGLVTPELPWGFPSTRFLAYFARGREPRDVRRHALR